MAHVFQPASLQSRIVNGAPAKDYQFPWFASIRSHTQSGLQSICGGSVIAPSWVLTAAHCTREYVSYTLGFGSNNINIPLVSMRSQEAIEHTKFNPANLNYDIALIKLPKSLTFSSRIQALRMPTLAQSVSAVFHTNMARVCGYGRTSDCKSFFLFRISGLFSIIKFSIFSPNLASQALSPELQWVDNRIISSSQCRKTYGPSVVLLSTLCTIGWNYNEQSTCNGDSGGPLVIDEGGIWTQIGVVSFVSNQGCGSGHPAGYVRTTSFLNWISMHTGISIRL